MFDCGISLCWDRSALSAKSGRESWMSMILGRSSIPHSLSFLEGFSYTETNGYLGVIMGVCGVSYHQTQLNDALVASCAGSLGSQLLPTYSHPISSNTESQGIAGKRELVFLTLGCLSSLPNPVTMAQSGSTMVAGGNCWCSEGEPFPIMRSAMQMIDEADSDLQVGDLLKDCLLGG